MKGIIVMKKLCFWIIIGFFISGCESSVLDDPASSIQFAIPKPSHVKVTVENSYNTVMAILMDQDVSAGLYQVNFAMDNLAEGIYFYIIEVNGLEDNSYSKTVKTMFLVKP